MLNINENIKTKTINYRKDWRIDIVEITENDPNTIELWLYHKDYGIKDLMFGLLRNDLTLEELEDIIDGNIDIYIPIYTEKYEVYD